MPEHAKALIATGTDDAHVLYRRVHTQKLVVAGHAFHEPAWTLEVRNKVFDQIEKGFFRARSADRGFQRNHTAVAVSIDHFPVAEELPCRVRCANFCF